MKKYTPEEAKNEVLSMAKMDGDLDNALQVLRTFPQLTSLNMVYYPHDDKGTVCDSPSQAQRTPMEDISGYGSRKDRAWRH
jgi:hypothetical protein